MLTPGPRRLARLAAAATALASAVVLPLTVAGPASADQARQRQQWVLNALDVPAAWSASQGQGVTVAVIDSGVDPAVSDLTGQVTTGPDYTGVHTPPSNPNWGAHGTWMASLIAGHGHGPGDKNGILGVAPKSHILSVRVITDRTDPGYAAYQAEPAWRGQRELANAIKYAVRHHVGVISMSLGYDAPSTLVRAALQYALRSDVVVVASSGNSGTTHSPQQHGAAPYSFPADYPGVIGVAAVNQSGQPAYFSSENLSVEVAAPGVNVPAQGRGSRYWVVSGTSPACALTAGVAALIRSKYPKLSAAQVREAIISSSAHRPKGGYDDHVGFGTVDAAAALRAASRLGSQVAGGQTQAGRRAAAGNFGGGESGVAAFPVPPQGKNRLYLLLGLAAISLLVLVLALWWLVRRRRGGTATVRRAAAPGPAGPLPGAGQGPGFRPDAGPAGPDVRYPTQIFPAQPFRQGRPAPGTFGQTVQGYPAAGYPGQPPGPGSPEQAGPGMPPASGPGGGPAEGAGGFGPGAGYGAAGGAAGYAGQGYPGPGYAGPGYPEPGYPEPGYPEPGYAGPGYPEPGNAGPGQAGQVYPGPGYAGAGGPGAGASGAGGAGAGWQSGSGYPGADPAAGYPGGGPVPPGVAAVPPGWSGPPEHGYQPQLPPGQVHPGLTGPTVVRPGIVQSGPVQSGPAQPGIGQPWPDQPGGALPTPAQAGPGQAGPAQAGPAQPAPGVFDFGLGGPPVMGQSVTAPGASGDSDDWAFEQDDGARTPPAADLPIRPEPPPPASGPAAPAAPGPQAPPASTPPSRTAAPSQPQSDMDRWLADPLTSPRVPDSVLRGSDSWRASRLGDKLGRTDVTGPFRSPGARPGGRADSPAASRRLNQTRPGRSSQAAGRLRSSPPRRPVWLSRAAGRLRSSPPRRPVWLSRAAGRLRSSPPRRPVWLSRAAGRLRSSPPRRPVWLSRAAGRLRSSPPRRPVWSSRAAGRLRSSPVARPGLPRAAARPPRAHRSEQELQLHRCLAVRRRPAGRTRRDPGRRGCHAELRVPRASALPTRPPRARPAALARTRPHWARVAGLTGTRGFPATWHRLTAARRRLTAARRRLTAAWRRLNPERRRLIPALRGLTAARRRLTLSVRSPSCRPAPYSNRCAALRPARNSRYRGRPARTGEHGRCSSQRPSAAGNRPTAARPPPRQIKARALPRPGEWRPRRRPQRTWLPTPPCGDAGPATGVRRRLVPAMVPG